MPHKGRWQIAQAAERKGREREKYTPESINGAKPQFVSLLKTLKECGITFDDSHKLLDIGSAGTSVFSVLRKGQRYAVDSLCSDIFDLYPFLNELEEYKGVNFINSAIEDADFNFRFDAIFMINLLDHTKNPQKVADKVKSLLAPGGYLIITVDTYNDKRIRDVIQFFDPDPAHPHHFMREDINALFSEYRMIKYDDNLFSIHACSDRNKGANKEAKLLVNRLVNLPIGQVISYLISLGMIYAVKHIACYATLFFLYLLRRTEIPVQPLNIRRLFIFRNDEPCEASL